MEKIMGVVRAGVAAVGGFLVAMGYASSADLADFVTNVETILGAVAVAGTAAMSIYAKVKSYVD